MTTHVTLRLVALIGVDLADAHHLDDLASRINDLTEIGELVSIELVTKEPATKREPSTLTTKQMQAHLEKNYKHFVWSYVAQQLNLNLHRVYHIASGRAVHPDPAITRTLYDYICKGGSDV